MPATPPPLINQHSKPLRLLLSAGSTILHALLKSYYWITPVQHKARTRALIQHNGYILLVRNVGDDSHWGLPGGGVKPHEPPLQSVMREVREELGVRLSESQFTYVGEYDKSAVSDEFAMICYTANVQNTLPINALSIELIEARWFAQDDLPTNIAPVIRLILNDIT